MKTTHLRVYFLLSDFVIRHFISSKKFMQSSLRQFRTKDPWVVYKGSTRKTVVEGRGDRNPVRSLEPSTQGFLVHTIMS